MNHLEKMLNDTTGKGKNPWTVNVVTFSGHGITVDGDAVAIIPEKTEGEFKPRFLNMSGYARKFASKSNSINIFIMSMCRLKNFKLTEPFYSRVEENTQGKHEKYSGYGNGSNGYSIMIFDCQDGTPAVDGKLRADFI